MTRWTRTVLAAVGAVSAAWAVMPAASRTVRAGDLEAEPIRYSKAMDDNPAGRLARKLEAGTAALESQRDLGRLRAVLKALEVPESSQVLVFSKTSLQAHRIGPRTPRALYFNDDVYVGFCKGGEVVEVSAADPALGTVFYTLNQSADEPARLTRQGDNCLICHGSSRNHGLPGHLVRSVYVDREGYPILSAGGRLITHESPFEVRWGGWYVTGTHGSQRHLGNLAVAGRDLNPERVDNSQGQNVTDLSTRFETGDYLTPHSDLVALMVLEHQAEMHNLIARATLQGRMALHDEAALNRELGRPAGERWGSTESRLKAAAEPVARYMLFAGEPPLAEPVKGTSSFAADYAARGPKDSKGRSLRELDLKRRLLRYPCSPLIYSKSFDAMPREVRDRVLRRMLEVLSGRDTSKDFAHLSAEDRRAILEILRETKPDLPEEWHR
jgi:hypothetical protein